MSNAETENIGWYAKFKLAVKKLKREVLAIYYALEDGQVGLLPRIIAVLALGYALSPLDLIPDFIPVLGLIDDLIILPGLIWLCIYLIPHDVMVHARERAATEPLRLAKNWVAAVLFFLLWDAFFGFVTWELVLHYGNPAVKAAVWWIVGGVEGLAILSESIWATIQIRQERRKQQEAATADLNAPLLAEP